MSTALAIASVTQVLKNLLNNGLIDNDVTGTIGGNVNVSALPPDRIDTSSNEQAQLNLFMYQALPNPAWRNSDLPSLNRNGERMSNPPLALDLLYLLTAYGAKELHAEVLLGYGMQLLHETPVLGREAIRTTLSLPSPLTGSGLPIHLEALATSELAEQTEMIKITPELLNAEELSKIWTSFQTKYRPTCAYKATVVLIESKKSIKTALPVLQRKIYAKPFHTPVLEKLKSQSAAGAPIIENQKILAGYNLVLEGRQLKGTLVKVQIDDSKVVAKEENISDTRISITIPSNIPAGVHGVQIIHEELMGDPETAHKGTSSNIEAFILTPSITNVTITNLGNIDLEYRKATLNLSVNPPVHETQKIAILLNQRDSGSGVALAAYSFEFTAKEILDGFSPSALLKIPLDKIKAGIYLVRVQVDRAESPLQTNSSGEYSQPIASIL